MATSAPTAPASTNSTTANVSTPTRRGRRRRTAARAVRAVELVIIVVLSLGIVGFLPVMTFTPAPLAAAPATSAVATGHAVATLPRHGWRSITEDTNVGAIDPSRACGQAAAATIIEFWHPDGGQPGDPAAVRSLESRYPRDAWWGIFGTSPSLETRMLDEAGLKTGWGSGETSLRAWVGAGYPVIVVQDVGPAWHVLGMHTTVIYAYDDDYVYLTNWANADGNQGRVNWGLFRQGWTEGMLMRGSGVAGRFLVATP